jgi:hypothetical protein
VGSQGYSNIIEFVRFNGLHAPFTDILLLEREFMSSLRELAISFGSNPPSVSVQG